MPPVATPRMGGPKGKGLNAKIGGIPVWLLGGGILAAVAVGLYLRKHGLGSGGSSASSPASSPSPDAGAGGGASGGASTPDLTPLEDLANSIYGLIPFLGSGSFSGDTSTSTGDTTGPQPIALQPTFAINLQPAAVSTPASTGAATAPTYQASPYAGYTATELQSVVSTPSPQGVYPASQSLPFPVQSQASPKDVYSASSTQGVFAVDLPLSMDTSSPATVPAAPHQAATVVQPTPSTYGITTGPTAGQRASSNKKQGVYTVH